MKIRASAIDENRAGKEHVRRAIVEPVVAMPMIDANLKSP